MLDVRCVFSGTQTTEDVRGQQATREPNLIGIYLMSRTAVGITHGLGGNGTTPASVLAGTEPMRRHNGERAQSLIRATETIHTWIPVFYSHFRGVSSSSPHLPSSCAPGCRQSLNQGGIQGCREKIGRVCNHGRF